MILLAVGVVLLAVLYVVQYQKTGDAREQVAALEDVLENELLDNDALQEQHEAEKADIFADVDELKSKNDQLLAKIDELENEAAQKKTAVLEDAEDTPAMEEFDEAPPKEVAKKGAKGEWNEYMTELMKNPEMRQMIRDNLGPQLDMMYGDMFDKLFLDEPQLAQFKELLTDMQMLDMEKMFGENKEDTGIELERDEITEEMQELLGEDRFRQYEDYQNNLAEMMALSQYNKRLVSNNVEPLADYQEVQLLSAIKEEKEKFEFVSGFTDKQNMDMTRFTQENLKLYFEEKDELTALILERSREILTEEQFAEYKSSTEGQQKLERMGMEMAVKMYGTDGEDDASETTNTVPAEE